MTEQQAQRVLVTGACGEIGQALVRRLAKTLAPGAHLPRTQVPGRGVIKS